MIFGVKATNPTMKVIALAAGLCLAMANSSCIHKFTSDAAEETTAAEIDPYAPAAPAGAQDLASGSPELAEKPENTGSDKPVTVDPMLKDEPPTQATRDYSAAFDDKPDYKPAGTNPTATAKSKTTRGTGAKRMVVLVERINLRSSPDRNSKITGELRRGDIVMVNIDEAIGWAKITDGEFIRARFLKSAEN